MVRVDAGPQLPVIQGVNLVRRRRPGGQSPPHYMDHIRHSPYRPKLGPACTSVGQGLIDDWAAGMQEQG
jgi:hypothetical protein